MYTKGCPPQGCVTAAFYKLVTSQTAYPTTLLKKVCQINRPVFFTIYFHTSAHDRAESP